MMLNEVSFQNYRNIEKETIRFYEGTNVLLGDNAQGKTNVLEGIYVFAAGKSFRGAKDRELISFGKERAQSSLCYTDSDGDEQNLEIRYSDKAPKTMKKNGVTVRKVSDFVGNFRAVLFCPEHLSLIKGPASGRRAYLDLAISQLKPSYLHALMEYGALLKQRNSLLKKEGAFLSELKPLLEVLSEQMSVYHAQIVRTRARYIEVVREQIRDFLCDLTGGSETVSMFYESMDRRMEEENVGEKEFLINEFLRKSAEASQKDYRAGQTTVGCHRDDFSVFVNGHEARQFCSQGQDRSLVLALKLAEGEISKTASGDYPVFLFDDVLSELDKKRQDYLLHHIRDRQVILTACWDDGSFQSVENVSVVNRGSVCPRE